MSISTTRVGCAVLPSRSPAAAQAAYADPDQLAALIREALLQAGLGQKNPEAPLAEVIQPGMTVLLKPNWVLHENQSGEGMDCMVTHPNFILAALKEVLAAQPGKVIIGDAPIQDCQFDRLVPLAWRHQVEQLAACPIEVVDFRRTILKGRTLQDGVWEQVRPVDRYVLFDLARDSLLEPTSAPSGRFRVTKYNPDKLAKTHCPGKHQYLLCREAFEADVILNLPKLKTHRKAGITAALKNLVGLNGNKDYLPHHRVGGTGIGGDCYPGFAPLKRAAEFCLDNANRTIGEPQQAYWDKAIHRLMRWQRKIGDTELEGGWHGNDTVWRMVLDLNRLLLYGRADGSLSDTPLRSIYSLTDAIVAGEAEGPLAPSPIALGAVTFAATSVWADRAHAALMGFDWRKIPSLQGAFQPMRYALVANPRTNGAEVFVQSQMRSLEELAAIGLPFRPAQGWRGYLELAEEIS